MAPFFFWRGGIQTHATKKPPKKEPKRSSNWYHPHPQKRSKTSMYTPFFRVGAGEAERKEKRSRSPKTEWSRAILKAPSYLSRGCDVTYVNEADQMTHWTVFNFLRANGNLTRGE